MDMSKYSKESSDLPSTIKYPKTFNNSPAAGFDGVFDWSWTDGCFGEGKITPMDFDGVIERKGNFLLFETKNVGVPIPDGQMYTFESAYRLGVFTIIFIEGKNKPETAKIWCANGFKNGLKMDSHAPVNDMDKLKDLISSWYEYANKNATNKVDSSFLNKKILLLTNSIEETKQHLTCAVTALGGNVEWR